MRVGRSPGGDGQILISRRRSRNQSHRLEDSQRRHEDFHGRWSCPLSSVTTTQESFARLARASRDMPRATGSSAALASATAELLSGDLADTCVSDTATPTSMPTDPGHKFADILQQLCGPGTQYVAPNYPTIDLSGFAATYATSADEKTGLPTSGEIGDIMACFNAPSLLPNINRLATNYVICDHWFSSLPGPTGRTVSTSMALHRRIGIPEGSTTRASTTVPPPRRWPVESVDGFIYQADPFTMPWTTRAFPG